VIESRCCNDRLKSQPKSDVRKRSPLGLSEDEIGSIEEALGCELPSDVRAIYMESDGLVGPTDCYLLYPLHENRGHQIFSMNRLKQEDWFPDSLKSLVILGDDGCGNLVCYDSIANDAVLWNSEDGERIQERRATVSEIWDVIRDGYKQIEQEQDSRS